MGTTAPIEIRSYRAVFELERRIYRVDRLRLNPSGIPIRGVAYCVALLGAAAGLGHVPLAGSVIGILPWYLRYLLVPVGGAAVMAMVSVEGRPFHRAAMALARYLLAPRRLVGMQRCSPTAAVTRWQPPELLILPDGSDHHLRRLRFTGPGAVLVAVVHAGAVRHRRGAPRLSMRPLPGRRPLRGGVLEVAAGVRLDVFGGR